MTDIQRMATEPTEEDRAWMPEVAGKGDWLSILQHVWANYRDESFIQQYLSPKVMRDFRMFALADRQDVGFYTVTDIHNEQGYREIRNELAQNHDISVNEPDIQIVDVDLLGDRTLMLNCSSHSSAALASRDRDGVLTHIERLWGYDVVLEETPLKAAAE